MARDPDDDLAVTTTLDARVARSDEPTLPHEGAAGAEADVTGGQLGRYLMAGLLGSGGMGLVFAAYDPELDRKVALKVLKTAVYGRRSSSHATLAEEARAMARLAHPNVLTVYEVGEVGGQEFLAMELVEGQTLRAWQDAAPRGWREVVAMYLAAGRGLVAAHDVGLVHRDFKPENVLIGADGRPRVADFGLVVAGIVPSGEALGRGELRRSMTVDGAAAGTPPYMAPEQWRGHDVGPAADQFAFSVALWEAICGARPFPGQIARDIRAAVLGGEVTPPPSGKMPRWLEAALRRGLAHDEAERWPSLRALLGDLARRTQPVGRTPLLVAGTGLAVLGAGLLALRSTWVEPACPAPRARTDAVWSDARRADVARHLAAVDPARGMARLGGIAPVLGRATEDWSAMHVEACRASRVEGRQSDLLLERRMRCLDDWLAELDARVAVLMAARDAGGVDSAAEGAVRLPPMSTCADADLLLEAGDPQRARVEALDRQASALLEAGDVQRAPRALDELLELASRIRDDRRAASAWLRLLRMQASLLMRPDRAILLIPAAEAAVSRAGGPLELRVELLAETAAVLSQADRLPEALARLGEARVLLARAGAAARGSPLGLQLAEVLARTGQVRMRNRQPGEALVALDEARGIVAELLGADHPRLVDIHIQRSEALGMLGRGEASLAEARTALGIRERRQPESAALADTLSLVALVLHQLGRGDEALDLSRRSVELGRRVLPASSAPLSVLIVRHAELLIALGRGADAVPDLEAALVAGGRQLTCRFLLGRILVESRRDVARGEALVEEARRGLVAAGASDEVEQIDRWLGARRP